MSSPLSKNENVTLSSLCIGSSSEGVPGGGQVGKDWMGPKGHDQGVRLIVG